MKPFITLLYHEYDPSFLLDFTGTGRLVLDPERVVIDALWSHGRQRADAAPGPFRMSGSVIYGLG